MVRGPPVPWRGGLRVPSAESGSTGHCPPQRPPPPKLWRFGRLRGTVPDGRKPGAQRRVPAVPGWTQQKPGLGEGREAREASGEEAAGSSRSRHWPPATGGRSPTILGEQ